VNSKQRLAIILSALAALVALLVVLPVFGADATSRFPKTADTTKVVSWVKQGGNLMLEVTDSDLNTGTATTLSAYAECAANATVTIDRFTPAVTTTVPTTNFTTSTSAVSPPILDKNSDGVVNYSDVTSSNANLQVESVDSTNGTIKLRCLTSHGNNSQANNDGTFFTLSFNVGTVNVTSATGAALHSVKIASDNDSTGINVRLQETSANSGIFRGVARLTTTASTSTKNCITATAGYCSAGAAIITWGYAPEGDNLALYSTTTANGYHSVGDLRVNAADTVVLTYVDGATGALVNRTYSIKVETTAPAFTNFTPANASASTAIRPTVTSDVTDSDSGVDTAAIQVIWGLDTDNDGDIDTTVTDTVSTIDQTTVTGGKNIRQRYGTDLTSDQTVYWWVKSTDTAGNIGVSDRMTVTAAGAADACNVTTFLAATVVGMIPATSTSVKGCQPYSISIDRTTPTVALTITGSWWNPTLTTTDKTVTDATLAKNSVVRIDFDGSIDGNTVQTSDFTVGGVTPISVIHYAGRPGSVFATVAALGPEARPAVTVVGEIKDLAGNAIIIGSAGATKALATDGIAPTLTLIVGSGTRPVTKTKVALSLSSNENASTATVVIRVQTVGALTAASATTTISNPAGGPKVWTSETTPGSSGLFNVNAQATDLNNTSNVGTVGQGIGNMTIDLTKAILFEVDNQLPAPDFLPATAGTDDAGAVVSINFTNEGQEYGLKSTNTVLTLTPSDAKSTNFDSYKTVTVTKATLDGVEITTALSSVDNIRFLYKPPSGLTIATHTLVVEATDVAGNTGSFTHTFKVTVRAAFVIPLVPGWNMISFPNTPSSPGLDDVFGTTPVTKVMAYDPSTAALWRVATRATTADSFSGTLTEIDSKLAYWVETSTFQSISTAIPRIAGGAAVGGTPASPPTIAIQKGWNLVPVIDVTGDIASGAAVSGYFASITQDRVYYFNTLLGKWEVKTGDPLVGKAYWVFASAADTLVP